MTEPLALTEFDWKNDNFTVDLRDDSEYEGQIHIRYGDDYTPIFLIDKGDADSVNFQFRTKYVFANKYRMTFHTYDKVLKSWGSYSRLVIFSLAVRFVVAVNGTEMPNVSKCCIYFNKEESTGEEDFHYWAKQIKYYK